MGGAILRSVLSCLSDNVGDLAPHLFMTYTKKPFATKIQGVAATGLGLFSYLCNNTPKT